jgi:hypothetical protein
MEKIDDQEICVIDCPVGAYADLRQGKCQCPMYSLERQRDDKRFCECPAHSQWNNEDNKCECANSGLILTHRGCVEDHSEECFSRPMSMYMEAENACVTVSNCPDTIGNCRRCETKQFYDQATPA